MWHVDVWFSDVLIVRWMFGLDDLKCLFQLKLFWFCDTIILEREDASHLLYSRQSANIHFSFPFNCLILQLKHKNTLSTLICMFIANKIFY